MVDRAALTQRQVNRVRPFGQHLPRFVIEQSGLCHSTEPVERPARGRLPITGYFFCWER